MADTATKLSWEEIKRTFPDEWVVLLDYELDGDIPVTGVVVDHGAVKRDLYKRLHDIDGEWFVLYTGRMRRRGASNGPSDTR